MQSNSTGVILVEKGHHKIFPFEKKHNLGSVTTFCDYTVMVKGTVLASGPTDTTFTAENLELAFSGVLRHVTLNGSEESIITDDERPFVTHRPSAVQREER
jgi:manganese/iron transport system ATP-binding protein